MWKTNISCSFSDIHIRKALISHKKQITSTFQLIAMVILSMICMQVQARQSVEYYISNTDVVDIAVFGSSSSETSHEVICPAGYTLGLIDVEYGWHHLGQNGVYVNGVRIGCSKLDADGTMDVGVLWQSELGHPEWFGNTNGTDQDVDCYPQQWMGIYGRTGSYVDQLGGYCGDIDDVLTGQSTTTLPAVGGGGGSPASRSCGAGYIPIGAIVNVFWGSDYINGIQLKCGKVLIQAAVDTANQLVVLTGLSLGMEDVEDLVRGTEFIQFVGGSAPTGSSDWSDWAANTSCKDQLEDVLGAQIIPGYDSQDTLRFSYQVCGKSPDVGLATFSEPDFDPLGAVNIYATSGAYNSSNCGTPCATNHPRGLVTRSLLDASYVSSKNGTTWLEFIPQSIAVFEDNPVNICIRHSTASANSPLDCMVFSSAETDVWSAMKAGFGLSETAVITDYRLMSLEIYDVNAEAYAESAKLGLLMGALCPPASGSTSTGVGLNNMFADDHMAYVSNPDNEQNGYQHCPLTNTRYQMMDASTIGVDLTLQETANEIESGFWSFVNGFIGFFAEDPDDIGSGELTYEDKCRLGIIQNCDLNAPLVSVETIELDPIPVLKCFNDHPTLPFIDKFEACFFEDSPGAGAPYTINANTLLQYSDITSQFHIAGYSEDSNDEWQGNQEDLVFVLEQIAGAVDPGLYSMYHTTCPSSGAPLGCPAGGSNAIVMYFDDVHSSNSYAVVLDDNITGGETGLRATPEDVDNKMVDIGPLAQVSDGSSNKQMVINSCNAEINETFRDTSFEQVLKDTVRVTGSTTLTDSALFTKYFGYSCVQSAEWVNNIQYRDHGWRAYAAAGAETFVTLMLYAPLFETGAAFAGQLLEVEAIEARLASIIKRLDGFGGISADTLVTANLKLTTAGKAAVGQLSNQIVNLYFLQQALRSWPEDCQDADCIARYQVNLGFAILPLMGLIPGDEDPLQQRRRYAVPHDRGDEISMLEAIKTESGSEFAPNLDSSLTELKVESIRDAQTIAAKQAGRVHDTMKAYANLAWRQDEILGSSTTSLSTDATEQLKSNFDSADPNHVETIVNTCQTGGTLACGADVSNFEGVSNSEKPDERIDVNGRCPP